MQTESKAAVVLCQDKNELADKAAKNFAALVADISAKQGACTVALSGGSTPKLLYERLLKPDLADSIPWDKIQFYVSDERCVAHASDESNWGNADRMLFHPKHIATAQQHATVGQDKNPDQSAADYETLIRKEVKAGPGGLPQFDIIYLGMGPDGHTASLFPGSKAIDENQALVTKNFVEKFDSNRITFTFPLINNAKHVIFLVAGHDKAEVLAEVMNNAGKYPSERVNPTHGQLTWFIDKEAAANL
jgi:6-phosphogluconolactonase